MLYRYRGITQWFTNGPSGVEQGFDVARPQGAGHLTLALTSTGNVTPALAQNGTVIFRGPGDLHYGGLTATDRTGRRLPATLSVAGGQIRISVDTRGARFPVRIDPTIANPTMETGELDSPGETSNDTLGSATAVSGSTVVVGAPAADNQKGLAYVFSTSGAPPVTLSAPGGQSGDALRHQRRGLRHDGRRRGAPS